MSTRRGMYSATVAAMCLVSSALLSGCSNSASSSPSTTATSQSASPSSGVRLGCGSFCQNAGGYGSGGEDPTPRLQAATIDTSGAVITDAGGYVPITVTCNLPVQCRGLLMLSMVGLKVNDYDPPVEGEGRSDLIVDSHATRTIGVPLPRPILAYLQTYGAYPFYVNGDVSEVVSKDPFKKPYPNGDLWPCEAIPELAPVCPVDFFTNVVTLMVAVPGSG